MKKINFTFFACMLLLSTACNTGSDNEKGTMDSIGNPTPNPKHTDTLRSINDTISKTDTLYR